MMDLPLDTPDLERIQVAYGRWLGTFILGQPGGIPWLTIAALVGVACGLLGYAWRRRGIRAAGVLIAIPFVVERRVHLLGLDARIFPTAAYGRQLGNLAIWLTEAVFGIALLWLLWRAGSVQVDPPQR